MVGGDCLKRPRKTKFRELKNTDEENALLGKSVPKPTRFVTKCSFNSFAVASDLYLKFVFIVCIFIPPLAWN